MAGRKQRVSSVVKALFKLNDQLESDLCCLRHCSFTRTLITWWLLTKQPWKIPACDAKKWELQEVSGKSQHWMKSNGEKKHTAEFMNALQRGVNLYNCSSCLQLYKGMQKANPKKCFTDRGTKKVITWISNLKNNSNRVRNWVCNRISNTFQCNTFLSLFIIHCMHHTSKPKEA